MPPADAAPSPGQTWDFSDDTTLIRCLARNAEVFPDRAAMREKSKGIWQEISWRELLDIVLSFAAGLEDLGFKAGDTMLVVGDNRPRLYAGMLSAGALQGYAMPAFADATLEEINHFVHEANARFALAEDADGAPDRGTDADHLDGAQAGVRLVGRLDELGGETP